MALPSLQTALDVSSIKWVGESFFLNVQRECKTKGGLICNTAFSALTFGDFQAFFFEGGR